MWQHSLVPSVILTISGHDGADARPYQEDELQQAIIRVTAVLEQREP